MIDFAFLSLLWVAAAITWQPFTVRAVWFSAIAFGISALISTVFSVNVALSLSRLAWLGECAAMALLVWNFSHRMSAVELFDAVSLPVTAFWLLPAFQWVQAGLPLWYRLQVETNNAMGLMSVLIFPAVALKRLWLVPVGTWLAWFTASRGGTLALLSGELFSRSRWVLIPVAAAIASMLFMRTEIVVPSVSGELINSQQDVINVIARVQFWRMSLDMWRESPVVGMGLWSGLIYLPIGHAHNLWFNTLAEQGVLGVTTLAALVVSIGRSLWKARAWSALASFAALNVHSLFDTPTSAAYIVLAMSAVVVLGLQHNV